MVKRKHASFSKIDSFYLRPWTCRLTFLYVTLPVSHHHRQLNTFYHTYSHIICHVTSWHSTSCDVICRERVRVLTGWNRSWLWSHTSVRWPLNFDMCHYNPLKVCMLAVCVARCYEMGVLWSCFTFSCFPLPSWIMTCRIDCHDEIQPENWSQGSNWLQLR